MTNMERKRPAAPLRPIPGAPVPAKQAVKKTTAKKAAAEPVKRGPGRPRKQS